MFWESLYQFLHPTLTFTAHPSCLHRKQTASMSVLTDVLVYSSINCVWTHVLPADSSDIHHFCTNFMSTPYWTFSKVTLAGFSPLEVVTSLTPSAMISRYSYKMFFVLVGEETSPTKHCKPPEGGERVQLRTSGVLNQSSGMALLHLMTHVFLSLTFIYPEKLLLSRQTSLLLVTFHITTPGSPSVQAKPWM